MKMRSTLLPAVMAVMLGATVAQGASAAETQAQTPPPAPAATPTGGMGPGMMGMGPGMMGMGPGMMGMGPGMMGMGPGMMGMGRIMMLDLTTEQRDKIGTIMQGVHKLHWDIMGKIADESRKLNALYAATPLDPKAVGAAFARLSDVRRQMVESMADTTNRMMELLTEEQRRQLKGQGN